MRNWLIGLSALLAVVIWQGVHLIYTVFDKQGEWQQEGLALAKEKTAIRQIDEISMYNGKQDFIVVEGKNEASIPMIAWFREGGLQSFAFRKDLTDKEAIKKTVEKENPKAEFLHVIPGMEDGRQLWEVLFLDEEKKFNYYYYDMKTGEFIRSYRLQKVQS